jgi:hypothetical protein
MLAYHFPPRSTPARFDLAVFTYGLIEGTGSDVSFGYDSTLGVACCDDCGEGVNSLSTMGSNISAGLTSFNEVFPTDR